MCYFVYIASDRPLPLIPWEHDDPGFYVAELWPAAEGVRKHFSKRHVYTLGGPSGCGCSLGYSPDDDGMGVIGDDEVPEQVQLDAMANDLLRRNSIRTFRNFLSTALFMSDSVELYCCWAGNEEAEVVLQRTVTLDHFGGRAFRFVEDEKLVVLRTRHPIINPEQDA